MTEERPQVKRDCFAYCKVMNTEKCSALKYMYCRSEKCKFYKNFKEYSVPSHLVNKEG